MSDWMEGTVYIRRTDKEGAETFTEHRCWSVPRFLSAIKAYAEKEGGASHQITAEQFREATRGKGRPRAS